ncbi:alginate lyase family protein [Salinicola peritrichatus]|uniref:alginate lyase family protein n=1 Tax=Salinicola peritrichatus TaxID=1267424 RepID=UPI000DA19542|nr:alginate lyase family protein [Salinicola peritrichatus]
MRRWPVRVSALALALSVQITPAGADPDIPQSVVDDAAQRIVTEASSELETPLYSVVDKTRMPASGDPHDYFSFAPYWWPDPERPDGLPFERRDGEYNQATLSEATDKQRLIDFVGTVKRLAWAYRIDGDPRYAERAIAQLRHWFIDPETRMHPNLRYAQAIPGRVDGRGIGIIESRLLIELADAIRRLEPALDDATLKALKQWYADYLDWLLASDNGRDEASKRNNHGTWYDAQVTAFARFVGRPELARRQLHEADARLAVQFDADGAQPLELERTRPWHYVNFNLAAWSVLLDEAEALGLKWPEMPAERQRLAAGFRWVAKYAARPRRWSFDELKGFHPQVALPNLVAARRHGLLGDHGREAEALIHAWMKQGDHGLSPSRLLAISPPRH